MLWESTWPETEEAFALSSPPALFAVVVRPASTSTRNARFTAFPSGTMVAKSASIRTTPSELRKIALSPEFAALFSLFAHDKFRSLLVARRALMIRTPVRP
jgi:hypothetical protein